MAPFAVGDAIEVAGAAADGFANAWFRATVESRRRPANGAVAVSDELAVSFPDFVRPDGSLEIETHAERSHRVRPAQPAPAVAPLLAEYQVGAGAVGAGGCWLRGLVGAGHSCPPAAGRQASSPARPSAPLPPSLPTPCASS